MESDVIFVCIICYKVVAVQGQLASMKFTQCLQNDFVCMNHFTMIRQSQGEVINLLK